MHKQTLSSQTNKLGAFLGNGVNFALLAAKAIHGKFQPFVTVTVNELLFGYEDTLVSMAHTFYPRNIRPEISKMGLLLGVSSIKVSFICSLDAHFKFFFQLICFSHSAMER